MDTLRKDLAFALRSLVRSPGLTAAAVLCLALGIGATATTWSVLRALVLEPVPVADGDRVVRITELPPNTTPDVNGASAAAYHAWREARAFDDVAAYRFWQVSVTGTQEPERVIGFRVSPGFFEILGARPLLGRSLTRADVEAGGDRLVVIAEPLWRRVFAADPAAIGQSIRLDGEPYRIVGVMPAEFIFPPGGELWAPLTFTPAQAADAGPNNHSVIARLASGVTLAQAESEARALHARIVAAHPDERTADWTALVEPVQHWYARNPRPYVAVMMGSVTLVLLIGCANVANLLLARATSRDREVAVRMALGAGRVRILRQLLTESIVLACAAGLVGVLLALWGVFAFRNSIPPELVRFNAGWTRIGVDGSVLLFIALVSIGTGVLFGLAPALQLARADVQGVLRENARTTTSAAGRRRLRSLLVVSEIALALTLLVGTGLMLRSFLTLVNADPGFRTGGTLTLQVSLPREGYAAAGETAGFFRELERRVLAIPGVLAVGQSSILPMDYSDFQTRVRSDALVDAREGDLPIVRTRAVTPGYFDALELRPVAGRVFDARDTENAPNVAVVSRSFARRFWPDEDPVGKRIQVIFDTAWIRVVGVVDDIRHNPNAGGDAVLPTFHRPHAQSSARSMAMLVNTAGSPDELAPAVRRAVASMDPAVAPGEMRTMERVVHNALAPQRTTTRTLALFGIVAVVLATIGTYGVIAYTVRQRTDELAIRMALGAARADIARLVLRQGGGLVLAGIGLGLVGATALARSMRAITFETGAFDPLAFTLAAATVGAVGLLACWLPAYRASRSEPARLLRGPQ